MTTSSTTRLYVEAIDYSSTSAAQMPYEAVPLNNLGTNGYRKLRNNGKTRSNTEEEAGYGSTNDDTPLMPVVVDDGFDDEEGYSEGYQSDVGAKDRKKRKRRRDKEGCCKRCFKFWCCCGFLSSFRSCFDRLMGKIEMKPRTVVLGRESATQQFPRNVIRNQKYNIITFIPLTLYNQFKIFLNMYFLVVAASQFIPDLRIGALYTYWGPLAFVVFVTMCREAYDDFIRFRRDREVNSQQYKKLTKKGIVNVPSSAIKVSDLIIVEKDQRVPADMVFLRTSEKNGACFLRTDQMDGETDWKLRLTVPPCQRLPCDDDLLNISASVYAEKPQKDVHSFVGTFTRYDGERTEIPLSIENTMWANTVIASGTAIGVVVYTGSETRSVMNTSNPETKFGLIDAEVNNLTKVLFAATMAVSFVMVTLKGFNGPWYRYFSRYVLLFSYIIPLSFTRGVTEHYDPEEPEFTEESFGYNPLESTGREWYCRPVDELIYQEYSERESTTWDYLASRNLDIKVINACSIEEITQEDRNKDKAMAWKLLSPSVLCTVGKSLSTGVLISLLAATLIGTLYTVICYACFNLLSTVNCGPKSNRLQTQWAFSGTLYCSFLYIWPFTVLLFLFRPFQLKGVKGKLFLVSFLSYCLDALYGMFLRALKLSHVSISSFLTWFPLNTIFIISVCLEQYVVTNHFCPRSRKIKKLILVLQMLATACFTFLVGQIGQFFVYPYFVKSKNKLLLALFFPLIGVVVKIISRICVQRLYNITHPGYSYTLLVPLYYGSAIIFRALQADLDSLENIAIIGIIHGAAEVIERSTMVFIDHIFYLLWKRKSAPWGSFRTPRRERLMADIAIMSMMSESTAIVSVNGFIYLFKFLCLQDSSLLMVLLLFAKFTLVQLVIEWFFTSVSLAIETRHQNLAVMAVWGRRWKRHILVAVVNIIPLALYTSEDLSQLVSGQPGDT